MPYPLERIDKNLLEYKQHEIFCFACVRNEYLRLPWFLEFHRRLGVDRFFIIDNGSYDGSTDYLLSQNDVHVFWTTGSYAQSHCGIDWINWLLDEYAVGHWALVLDADELFIYPNCEISQLKLLSSYLDFKQAQGMAAMMLDMYGKNSICKTEIKTGEPFLNVCSYFDGDSYEAPRSTGNNVSLPHRGGVRKRLFWEGKHRELPAPFLVKHPFVKWRKALNYEASTHIIKKIATANISGTLLHFKFFSDFHKCVREEVERKEHWKNGSQYFAYLQTMDDRPDLSLYYEGSVQYKNSMQIVKLGFMNMPSDYLDFISSNSDI